MEGVHADVAEEVDQTRAAVDDEGVDMTLTVLLLLAMVGV